MKVMITGAAGLVGSHLCQRLTHEFEVLALHHSDLDITDRDAVFQRFALAKPALVINCAVISVDECEGNPMTAHAINVEGPRNLAEAATESLIEFVHFSTNYVFGGRELGRVPYTIKDTPDPVNVYGKTKASGEMAVRKACARSYLIRTSWVYGQGKKSFLSAVHDDLETHRRVRAICDVWAHTTSVNDLLNRVVEILVRRRYGTYHVVNAGVCSYYDFALETGRLVGLTKRQLRTLIEVVREEELHRGAERPRYTPMRCLLSEQLGLPPMRHWRKALAEFVRS
jgi:dTDP-4-dehydrorhamnose reductase